MPTACIIGIVRKNGKVDCIICWSDGQSDATGSMLSNYYGNYIKATNLIAGGHIDQLNKKHSRVRYLSKMGKYTKTECKPVTYATLTDFFQANHNHRHTYLFVEGYWWQKIKSESEIMIGHKMKLFTKKETIAVLGVTVRTIERWTTAKYIKSIKIRSRRYYPESEIDRIKAQFSRAKPNANYMETTLQTVLDTQDYLMNYHYTTKHPLQQDGI